MARKCDNGHGFTYIWRIQNFEQWFHGISGLDIESPRFFVRWIKGSLFCLVLKKNGNGFEINYDLRNISDLEEIEVCSEVSFLEADSSAFRLQQKRKFSLSAHNRPFGFLAFIDKNNFSFKNMSLFLIKDELTVRCRLWPSLIKLEKPEICFASTKINAEKEDILWVIEGFGSTESEFKRVILSEVHKLPVIELHLYSADDNDSVHISIIANESKSTSFSFWHIAVVDAIGETVDSTKFGFSTSSRLKDAKLTTKSKLMANRDLFLPGDALILRCCCVTSLCIETQCDGRKY